MKGDVPPLAKPKDSRKYFVSTKAIEGSSFPVTFILNYFWLDHYHYDDYYCGVAEVFAWIVDITKHFIISKHLNKRIDFH